MQRRRREPSVILNPPPKERVESFGDFVQRQLRLPTDAQVPDFFPHGFQRRGADRGCEAAEQSPAPRTPNSSRSKAISEKVERDIRIRLFAPLVPAVDDLRLGGMQFQVALRQACLKL